MKSRGIDTLSRWPERAEAGTVILPGKQATVDIHTGEKTVLTCLVQPVLKLPNEAFRER